MIFEAGLCCGWKSAARGVIHQALIAGKDTSLSINHLTDSCLFHVKPDDERAQVVAELAERELDLVAVVEKGELVGCLMEKRSLIYRKMMLPKMFSFRGNVAAGKTLHGD